jgi:hypothetical protein
MIFSAYRSDGSGVPKMNGECITVHVTCSPVSIDVTEDTVHLRPFWGHLGRLISEAAGKEPGQRAYERYREHVGGVGLAHGDPLPAWEDNEQKYRDAWAYAETGF